MRNWVWSLTVCSSLLLLGVTSYPFHPERLMLLFSLGVIAVVVAAVLYVLIQLNYDDLTSRISGTSPNRFTLDSGFASSFLQYVVPVIGIVAIQLSGTFRFLLEPILRVLQ
jgi:hypothetical protein